MIGFKAILQKFGVQGEKTGWTYFVVPKKIAEKLLPGMRKSFRVKGSIDDHKIKQVALLPMGEGDFIMPVNGTMRKAIKKQKGATIEVKLEVDSAPLKLSAILMECLKDEPEAMKVFKAMSGSHQQYYSKWIESAKTDATKTKRVALAINAFCNHLDFGQMLRLQKENS